MSRLSRLLALPRGRRELLWACGWALLCAAWHVRMRPFGRVAAGLGAPLPASAALNAQCAPADTPGQALARDVRWAVAVWSRALPRRPTCLMQALAARRVLAARGVTCDLYFGVQAAAASSDAPNRPTIAAHAWLRCGDFVVTGEAEAAAFQPIALYRFNPAPRAGALG
jgi:hypothetical protein